MNEIWLTSDIHFGHNKEFLYAPRGFSSIEEHDEAIIERWNSIVEPGDTTYVLGDIMMNNIDKGMENLIRLNGNIVFVCGNHDTDNKVDRYLNLPWIEYAGYATMFKYGKMHFYMSHYPTICDNLDDKPLKKGVINLYGHTHQQTNFYQDRPNMYHVGMDSHNCKPVHIERVIEDIKKKVKEVKNER